MKQYSVLILACGEDIEITKNFTSFGIVVQKMGGSRQEVSRSIGFPHGV